jgi:hypothetical protein
MPPIRLSVSQCEQCHRRVGAKLLQCSSRASGACPYTLYQDSLIAVFAQLPFSERLVWITLLATPAILLFLGIYAFFGGPFQYILIALLCITFGLTLLIRSTMLLNLQAGHMWQGYSLFGLPLRSTLYRDVSLLSFDELDLKLPSIPFSVAGLRCYEDGTLNTPSRVEDAALLVEYALAMLSYGRHIQIIRMRKKKQGPTTQEITHLLKYGGWPEDGDNHSDDLLGMVESRLLTAVRFSPRPVTIGWAVRQIYDDDETDPARWLYGKVIEDAVDLALTPELSFLAIHLRRAEHVIVPERLEQFQRDKQLANDAMVAMYHKYPDLLRMRDAIKRAIHSRRRSSDD